MSDSDGQSADAPVAKAVTISVVSPDRFQAGTSQTPGSRREAAIFNGAGIETGLWGGTFLVEPGARTGVHHHGEQETIAYVLDGECVVRWGEAGAQQAIARAGDFVHVPGWIPHMEANLSTALPFRWIVVRSTSVPVVVNLPGLVWPEY